MSTDSHLSEVLEELRAALANEKLATDAAYLALLAARAEYPSLDLRQCEAELDRLAAAAETQYARAGGPRAAIRALNRVLFAIERFRGNSEDYFDPDNSYLNQVLRRRLGIPVTLCAVYMAVARRLGVCLRPIGLPLHFMVSHGSGADEVIIDPFYGGALRTRKECAQLVRGLAGVGIELTDEVFAGVSTRQMLFRLLNNLKAIYYRTGDYARAGRTVDLMLVLGDNPPKEIRDRGILYLKVGQVRQGVEYLARYLSVNPGADDAAIVREQIELVYARQSLRN